ncbi:MAG: ferritin [Bacteroidales bacterium]|jgi:ferritin
MSMLSTKLEKELNLQVQREFYSAGLYLAMSSWVAQLGYNGIAHWLEKQAEEEMEHGMKFYHYILDRGGKAIVPAIEQPPVEFNSVLEMFEEVLAHEQKVSQWISDIALMAFEEKDLLTWNWIQWGIEEQIEEETTSANLLEQCRLFGEKKLLFFDSMLSKRE